MGCPNESGTGQCPGPRARNVRVKNRIVPITVKMVLMGESRNPGDAECAK